MGVVNVPKIIGWQSTEDPAQDGDIELDWAAASQSLFVRNFFGEEGDVFVVDAGLPKETFRMELRHRTLETIRDYLRCLTESDARTMLQHWSREPAWLVEIAKTANFLHIPALIDATCRAMADLMRGRTPAEIRALFGITEEGAREREQVAREKLQWLLE